MTDTNDTEAALPPRPTEATPTQPSANPAEAQFPYLVTHGLQPTDTESPSLSRRKTTERRYHNWLPVVIVATITALALVAASLAWGDRPFLGPRSDMAARQAVHGYLEALAAGDATGALRYALHPPSDASLLTDEVLAEQRATAPITEIDVRPAIEYGRVPASYLLGPERVETVFELTFDDGSWRLNQVAAAVGLGDFATPIAVNGVTPRTSTPDLFPGRYVITAEEPRFEVADAAFTVRKPFEQPKIRASLQLSDAGQAEVIDAAKTHLAACLARADLDPPDCGFALTDPEQTPLDESTVSWSTHGGSDFADLAVELDHTGSATAELDLTVHGDIRGVDGSHWLAQVHLTKLRADLTGPRVQVQFG